MNKQDVLLDAMSNESDLSLLYGLWTIANNAPSRCAEILLNFKDVSRGCKIAVSELEDAKAALDRLSAKKENISSMIEAVNAWKAELKSIDEEVFLNRINRLCDVADRINSLKKTGALRSLKVLLEE
jgi:hypothetical protein